MVTIVAMVVTVEMREEVGVPTCDHHMVRVVKLLNTHLLELM